MKKLSRNRGYLQSTPPGCQGMDAASLLPWRLNPGVLAVLPDQRPHLCFGPGCQCWSLRSRWPSDPQGGYSSPSHHTSTVAVGTREREKKRERGTHLLVFFTGRILLSFLAGSSSGKSSQHTVERTPKSLHCWCWENKQTCTKYSGQNALVTKISRSYTISKQPLPFIMSATFCVA